MQIGFNGDKLEDIIKEMEDFIKLYRGEVGNAKKKAKKKENVDTKNHEEKEITITSLIEKGLELLKKGKDNENKIAELLKEFGIERLSACPAEKIKAVYDKLVKL